MKGKINISQKVKDYLDKNTDLQLEYAFNKKVKITFKAGGEKKIDLSTNCWVVELSL